jgi:dipeptidyl-peptidase-4
MAAKEILKWDFVDPERIAVWGWSGGGSATLNLMFQYPEIYKTGIAIAAVTNELTYDASTCYFLCLGIRIEYKY